MSVDGAAGPEPVLTVTDLRVGFPRPGAPRWRRRPPADVVWVVRGLGYALRAGETLALVGESGSGKSVASLAVMGLAPRRARVEGSVRLHGRELLGLDERAAARVRGREIAMVFQDPLAALTPVFSIGDQVAEAVRAHTPMSKARAATRAVELLDLVGIPDPPRRAASFPHELSGGMRQRVMIAMAIAHGPDVIIADEPTTALDATVQAQVLEALRAARRETGAAIVLITHDLGVVAGLADRVVVMYAGRPVEAGPVDDIFHRPRMPYTMGLLGAVPRPARTRPTPPILIPGAPPAPGRAAPGCVFAPRCPLADDDCRRTEPALRPVGGAAHVAACGKAPEIEARGLTAQAIFSGRRPPRRPPRTPANRAPAVLTVEDLVKHHRPVRRGLLLRRGDPIRAVDGIGFEVRAGEALGLVGESGSGKSTTLLEILRLAAPQRGRITVLGKDVSRLTPAERTALRRDVQVVFQDPTSALDPRLPVGEIVAEPLRAHRYARDRIERRVPELLRLVGLAPGDAARFPHGLSGGQRQRVGIARALALEPRLLLLDEPVSALDVSIRAGIVDLLDDLRARLGLAYLFVSHDLGVVRHLADRVAVMYLGRIVEAGAVSRVCAHPAHPYTEALLSAVPVPDPRVERDRRPVLPRGERPDPTRPPGGCVFHPRCPVYPLLDEPRRRECRERTPRLRPIAARHEAACHFVGAANVADAAGATGGAGVTSGASAAGGASDAGVRAEPAAAARAGEAPTGEGHTWKR